MVKSPTTPTAALIVEGDSSQTLFYGPDKTRWLQVDSVNGQVAAKTYYFDDFELRVAGNHTRKYHYLEEGLLTYMLDSSLTDHYSGKGDTPNSHSFHSHLRSDKDFCLQGWKHQIVSNKTKQLWYESTQNHLFAAYDGHYDDLVFMS